MKVTYYREFNQLLYIATSYLVHTIRFQLTSKIIGIISFLLNLRKSPKLTSHNPVGQQILNSAFELSICSCWTAFAQQQQKLKRKKLLWSEVVQPDAKSVCNTQKVISMRAKITNLFESSSCCSNSMLVLKKVLTVS